MNRSSGNLAWGSPVLIKMNFLPEPAASYMLEPKDVEKLASR